MAEYDRRYATAVRTGAGTRVEGIDQGLRAFMLGVYNNMALGLAITGLVAYGTYALGGQQPGRAQTLYGSPLRWVIMLAPLALSSDCRQAVHRMQPGTARLGLFAFAAVMGLSLSSIFIVFTGESIARTVLHHGRLVRRAEPLRLHDEEGPVGLRLVLIMGVFG
jgi:FtsH-binding integral membrane protein